MLILHKSDKYQKKQSKSLAVTEKGVTFALAIQERAFKYNKKAFASLAQLVEQLTLNQWV